MPEGHTIHRLARDHQRWFAGDRPTIASPQGRFSDEAAALDGCGFLRAEAHGKHLAHVYDHPETPVVHIHLGLFGRARSYKTPGPDPRDSVRYLLAGDKRALHLIGPNTCELLTAAEWQAVRDRLGPDPLRSDAEPDIAYELIRRRRRPLAAVLLDQKVIAGLGNVYRAEILFMLGLHPYLPARELDRDTFDRLWALSVDLLEVGVKGNRIVTAPKDEPIHPDVSRRKGDRIYVYKRRRCRRCATEIVKEDLEGRNLYWCPSCQSA